MVLLVFKQNQMKELKQLQSIIDSYRHVSVMEHLKSNCLIFSIIYLKVIFKTVFLKISHKEKVSLTIRKQMCGGSIAVTESRLTSGCRDKKGTFQ